jgi:hypothetical protein
MIVTLDNNSFEANKYNDYPETKFFKPKQVQKITINKYSDEVWGLSQMNRKNLNKHISSAASEEGQILYARG